MLALPHIRLAWAGRGWSSSQFGAQRSPCVESIVRGVKALGWSARAGPDGAWPHVGAGGPCSGPFSAELSGADACHSSVYAGQRPSPARFPKPAIPVLSFVPELVTMRSIRWLARPTLGTAVAPGSGRVVPR